MRIITPLAALILLAPAAHAAAADIRPLDVKEGLWETTSTISIQGLQIPPALLQSLPEKQRAQIERLDGKPRTERACVTQKDIADGFARFDKQSACTRETIASTPRKFEANVTCGGMFAGTGTARVEAPTPAHAQGSAALQSAFGPVAMSFDAHWIGASCESLNK